MRIYRRTPTPLTKCKRHLKDKKWSYRQAAKYLGVSHPFFSDVMNGWAVSAPLSKKVLALQECPDEWKVGQGKRTDLVKREEAK